MYKRKPLSKEAQESRKPLPPDVLVDALQDKVYIKPGRSRPAKTVRIKRKLSESMNKIDFEKSDK